MDEKNVTPAPEQSGDRDQALFASLAREKQRKKRRRLIVTVSIVVVLALAIFFGVRAAKKKVSEAVGGMTAPTVSEATVTTGSISTTVSGSGMLSDTDTKQIVLPKGVKLDKILVKAGESVKKGDALATVELSSVMGAMNDVQSELDKLDGELRSATGETVAPYISAGVAGRVKTVYAQKDDDVAACMMEHGALAVLSLDGYMAMDIDAGTLAAGDKVSVTVVEKTYPGTVDEVQSGKATILLTDNGPAVDAAASVQDADGNALGEGTLYIHNPLRITGYAGVVSSVNIAEERQVYAGYYLFNLRDTAYSANYESVLKTRREKEEDLLALLGMYSTGAVTAPFDGSVSSIDYSDKTTASSDSTTSGAAGGGGTVYGGMMNSYASYGSDGSDSSGGGASSSSSTDASGETKLLTLSPDTSMKLTVGVDETSILSVQNGQRAQVTVSSIGEDVFSGTVTAVERSAESSYGITSYNVEITMDKDPRMLPGMTAKAVIRIEGVDDALLIPEKALRQTRDSSFVYTTYDPATGALGGETPVITGLTGGGMVEIVEGLAEGQTVYYQEAYDPYAYYYGTGGDASGGDAWIEDASGGDAALASGGEAEPVPAEG